MDASLYNDTAVSSHTLRLFIAKTAVSWRPSSLKSDPPASISVFPSHMSSVLDGINFSQLPVNHSTTGIVPRVLLLAAYPAAGIAACRKHTDNSTQLQSSWLSWQVYSNPLEKLGDLSKGSASHSQEGQSGPNSQLYWRQIQMYQQFWHTFI